MRLWPRSPRGHVQRAARLVADHLGTRSLAAPLRAAIERTVAEQLRHTALTQLDGAMRAAIDLYAQADDADADNGPITQIDVRWTGVAAR